MPQIERAIPTLSGCRTEAEYLRQESASAVKHEFRGGRIVAMAGGTHGHGIIAGNLIRELGTRLRHTPCLTATSGVRVAAVGDYLYPDVSVVCDGPVYHPPDRRHTLVNPQVVVEVLSPSTARDDLGEKFDAYRQVESLREYVVVAADALWARSFHRDRGGLWAIGPLVQGIDATLAFRSLSVGVPLAEVYAKVEFPPADVDG